MKTRHIATTADELMRMLSRVRCAQDKTPSISASLIINADGSWELKSDNGGVEGVSLDLILKAIAEAVGLSDITVNRCNRDHSRFVPVPDRSWQSPGLSGHDITCHLETKR